MQLLLLEDDPIIAEQVQLYFEAKSHRVTHVESAEALDEIENLHLFDVFLFDINLPGQSGIAILKEIRELHIATPTIFMTALSDMHSIRSAYAAGCNDYLKKPFHLEELELRLLRLIGERHTSEMNLAGGGRFDPVAVRVVDHSGRELLLSEKEMGLLQLLAENPGRYLESMQIRERLWEGEEVNENTLRTLVRKLRAHIGHSSIASRRGTGYALMVEGG